MGYIKFNWIPFELCIAPGTFQRCIDTIFKKELGKLVLPYLDDIIIYSKTLEEHEKHLEVIFKKVKAAGIILNKKVSVLQKGN